MPRNRKLERFYHFEGVSHYSHGETFHCDCDTKRSKSKMERVLRGVFFRGEKAPTDCNCYFSEDAGPTKRILHSLIGTKYKKE